MWVNDLMRKNHYCNKLMLLTSVSKNVNNEMMRFGHKIHNFECACISTYGCEEIERLPRNNCEKMWQGRHKRQALLLSNSVIAFHFGLHS